MYKSQTDKPYGDFSQEIIKSERGSLKTETERTASDIACDIMRTGNIKKAFMEANEEGLENIFLDITQNIYIRRHVDLDEEYICFLVCCTSEQQEGFVSLPIWDFDDYEECDLWEYLDLVKDRGLSDSDLFDQIIER